MGEDGIVLSHGRQPIVLRTGTGPHRLWVEDLQDGKGMSLLDGACGLSDDNTMENVVIHIRSWSLTEATAKRTPIPQFLAATSDNQSSGSESSYSICGVVLERCEAIAAATQKLADCDTVADWSTEFSVQCLDFPFVALTVVAGIDTHVPECVMPGVVIEMCGMMRRRQGSVSARSFRIGPVSSVVPRKIAHRQIEWMCAVYCCRSPDDIEVFRSLEHASLSSLTHEGGEERNGDWPTVGCASLSISSVSRVRLWRRTTDVESACPSCSRKEWTVHVGSLADVDDGTSIGTLLINCFDVLLRLLQVSSKEASAIRDWIVKHGHVDITLAAPDTVCTSEEPARARGGASAQSAHGIERLIRQLPVLASRFLLAVVEARNAENTKEVLRSPAIQMAALPQLCHGARLFTASALSRTRARLIAHAVYDVPTKRAACSPHVAKQGAVVADLKILRERLRVLKGM
jgi:hypothetical protein